MRHKTQKNLARQCGGNRPKIQIIFSFRDREMPICRENGTKGKQKF